MSPIAVFFSANMPLVLFINGLAFFVMALAIGLEARRPSKLKLAEGLWLLAAFALMRSLANWVEMSLLLRGQAAPTSSSLLPLQTIKTLLVPLSCVLLLQFGIKSILAVVQKHFWLRWLSLVLILFWLLALIRSLYTYTSPGANAERLLAAEVWARYLFCLPGSALSGIAVVLHSRVFQEMKLPRIARNCAGAAVAFGLQAVFSGLIVPPAFYLPASILNESSFLAGIGVPVQVFRTISTLAIAYFVVRILEVFEIEQDRQLEAVTRQNFQAQREALEAQCRACEEIENWSKKLEDMISTIATAISQPLELKEILDIARRKALQLTGLESCMVFLVDNQRRELRLFEHQGLSQRALQDLDRMKFGEGIAGRVALSGEPIIVEDVSEDPRLISSLVQESGLRFMASVPLKSKGGLFGVMNLASTSRHSLTRQEIALLIAIGQQVGVAIENARLYEQLQSMAALEERSRISRELHDGLAQVLGYLHLKSKATERLLSSGQVAQAQAQLHEIQEVARQTYGDVRESILGLRTTITPGTGLIPALTEYLHKFSQQSGISARLVMDNDVEVEITPLAEIQFLRIVQEALTNIRKHSQASRVWVRFEADDGQALITVEDDGQGFDPSRIGRDGQEHFGLQTMRERAESVGGALQVSARPGQGTRLTVQFPLSRNGGT